MRAHAVVIRARSARLDARTSTRNEQSSAGRFRAGGARISARRRLHRPWLLLPHSVVGESDFRLDE